MNNLGYSRVWQDGDIFYHIDVEHRKIFKIIAGESIVVERVSILDPKESLEKIAETEFCGNRID